MGVGQRIAIPTFSFKWIFRMIEEEAEVPEEFTTLY